MRARLLPGAAGGLFGAVTCLLFFQGVDWPYLVAATVIGYCIAFALAPPRIP